MPDAIAFNSSEARAFMRAVVKTTAAMPAPTPLQSFFEAALSQITEAVIATDWDGRVQYMNAAAETLCGCTAAQAMAKAISDVVSIVDVVTGKDFLDAMGESREFRRALLLGREDQPKVIEYSVTAMPSGILNRAGCVIVFRDLMKLRISEQALEVSEATHVASAAALHEERERARVTLNSIGDAVVSTDFRGRVTFLNAIAEHMTGWTLQRATGRPLDEVFPVLDSQSRAKISCPAVQAIIEDHTCRSGATGVLVRPDGSEIAVDHSASPIHDAGGGVIGAVMVAHDATDARNHADTLTRLALYDSLTGLPNRMLLADRLDHALHSSRRNARITALLFMDLDGFKKVNDTDGHAVGDHLLQQVAHRLIGCVRSTDTVSRHGGDEFVVLLPDVHSAEDAVTCAGNIIAAMNQAFNIQGRDYFIGASIGISTQQSGQENGAHLLKCADIAMYHAKSAGRNRVSVYSEGTIDKHETALETGDRV